MKYSISALSRKTGLSIHTLRFYEKEGLLRYVERTESGRHVYSFEGSDAPRVLSAAGKLPGLRDAETGHAPIEEVIATLYQQWQQQG